MDKRFEKCQKWTVLKHRTYLVLDRVNKQISTELNSPSGGKFPFQRVLVAGASRHAASSRVGAPSFAWGHLDLPLSFPCASSMVLLAAWRSSLTLLASTPETPLDFERLAFLSAARALQRRWNLEWVGGWDLRRSFPPSWLPFQVPEGLVQLLLLHGCLPEPGLGNWMGSELLGTQGFLMG